MKIAIGSDHGGFNLKEDVIKYLKALKYDVVDCGCYDLNSCDYPVFAKSVCDKMSCGEVDKGILICTTGIGMSMTANRYKGVRAALINNEDMCRLTRQHNNSNVLVMGAKYTPIEVAKKYVDIFFGTEFEGGRHERRVNLIEKE
ncbi:MAG: ribose 5-phosphate isomerase B [Bacilli bacterium]|nr:ribose 5-phosphate isomerase B [Bacilli bacterium]